jgi:hypothetical protein
MKILEFSPCGFLFFTFSSHPPAMMLIFFRQGRVNIYTDLRRDIFYLKGFESGTTVLSVE